MRVVFLNPTGTVGGAERVLVNLIRSLRDIDPGLRLALIAGADGPLLEDARRAGAECQVLEMPPELRSFGRAMRGGPMEAAWRSARAATAAIAYAAKLRRALARLQPDVVHSNGVKFHILSGLKYVSDIPTVWHMHDFLSRRPVVGKVLRALHRRTISAVAVSSAVQKDCAKVLPGTQLTTVYNAVDTEHFSPDAGKVAALDTLAGGAADPRSACRVGLVATYARWKG